MQNQKPYRNETIERGGKASDSGSSTVTDIWNRRVRSDVNDLEFDQTDNTTWSSQDAYRSAELCEDPFSEQLLRR